MTKEDSQKEEDLTQEFLKLFQNGEFGKLDAFVNSHLEPSLEKHEVESVLESEVSEWDTQNAVWNDSGIPIASWMEHVIQSGIEYLNNTR